LENCLVFILLVATVKDGIMQSVERLGQGLNRRGSQLVSGGIPRATILAAYSISYPNKFPFTKECTLY
jgi:hypothetical protein